VKIVDTGTGPPVVVIPGIQGRWEWMKPGIDALATRCRVVTYSLSDEPSCGGRFDETTGFDCYVEQVREAIDQAGIERATICGVSYGGLVACAFAARYPERTRGLVLVSALPPSWTPDARVRFYLHAPRLLMPVFMVASLRMYREIASAHPGLWSGVREAARHGWNVLTHMFSPSRMARRVHLLARTDLAGMAPPSVSALVITGDSTLDRVVPVSATREYLQWLPHARMATVERTGHLGFITRPQIFADLVAPFAADAGETESRRRIG
jgi:pimeloyl-ACP methyl ester carboxylesterase